MSTQQYSFTAAEFDNEAVTKDMLTKKYIEHMALNSCFVDLVAYSVTNSCLIECIFNIVEF